MPVPSYIDQVRIYGADILYSCPGAMLVVRTLKLFETAMGVMYYLE